MRREEHGGGHLRGEQLAHVAVGVLRVQAQLSGSARGPQRAALGLRRAVNLVVDVLARVHVEAGVEEGAVPQALVRVLVDDAPGGGEGGGGGGGEGRGGVRRV